MDVVTAIALRREPGHFVRSLTALVLRLALGMIFLMAGLGKLQDIGVVPTFEELLGIESAPAATTTDDEPVAEAAEEAEAIEEAPPADTAPAEEAEAAPAEPKYPESIRGMFADTWLGKASPELVDLFLTALPYAETAVGALLILGLFTSLSSFVSGLVLVSLLFGWTVQGNSQMYPNMLTYILTDAAILWLSPVTSNYLSLDGLFAGWFWRPRSEGDFQRTAEPARRA